MVWGSCGQRDLLVIGPGPDAGGSNHGKAGWFHAPLKSGIGAALFAPAAGAAPVVTVCVMAGVAIAVAAKVTSTRKFR
jgi:hypothetical protein